jgi:hypothetical protein
MKGIDALFFMMDEGGRIVEIRNRGLNKSLKYADIEKEGINFSGAELAAEGWEIAYQCDTCFGTGVVMDRDEWKKLTCSDCSGGLRWRGEY